MNLCLRDPFIVNEYGQYYLLYADENGIFERAVRDREHLSPPRPLISPHADVRDIAAWASPQIYFSYLTVTVTTRDGRRGIRIFQCDCEYMPGVSVFFPLTDLITPPDWNCTDGRLFSGHLVFTRRSPKSSSIYTMPLSRDSRVSLGRPKRILPDGEAAVLWFTDTECRVPGIAMLYFSRGRACIASAASWRPDGAWTKRPLPIPVRGTHAALFDDPDGNLAAILSLPDGRLQLCWLVWQNENFSLIPQTNAVI